MYLCFWCYLCISDFCVHLSFRENAREKIFSWPCIHSAFAEFFSVLLFSRCVREDRNGREWKTMPKWHCFIHNKLWQTMRLPVINRLRLIRLLNRGMKHELLSYLTINYGIAWDQEYLAATYSWYLVRMHRPVDYHHPLSYVNDALAEQLAIEY